MNYQPDPPLGVNVFPNQSMQFFDASDPGVSQQMEAALVVESPRPEIGETHDDQVSLPGGFTYNGSLVRKARVRELTGADEEELARATTTEGLITTLLTRGVVSLGGAPLTTPSVLDSLLVGDRDALILGIRRVCFGDSIDFERYVCPGCAGEYSVSIDLNEIPTVQAKNPGDMEILVKLRAGRQAKVRLVTGYDQNALLEGSRTRKLTAPQQDSLLLSRTVLAIIDANGVEISVGADLDHVRTLSIGDRRAILRDLRTLRPGPRLNEVKITCPDCREEQEIELSVDALFRG